MNKKESYLFQFNNTPPINDISSCFIYFDTSYNKLDSSGFIANFLSNINNYVLTATGIEGTINGEANFTFDALTSTAFINGSLIVGSATTSSTLGLIRASNDVIAFASSDERLKENVVPISNSIEKINQIGGYEYDWIPMEGIHENTGHDIGVIAQEIEKVLPEIVTRRENGYLAVKYERIVALLIECVKEQQKQITNLENKINKIIE